MSLQFLLLPMLLLLSAFFSGSESALFSLSRLQIQRLRNERQGGGSIVAQVMSEPNTLLTTILLGNTFVNVTFAVIIGHMTTSAFGEGLGATLGVISATFTLLIFGEIAPKTYAIAHSESISLKTAPILLWFSSLILPIKALFESIAGFFLPLVGSSSDQEKEVTAEEFKAMLETSEAEGAIRRQESQLLHDILRLPSVEAKQVIVPVSKMICAEVSLKVKDVLELAQRHGHSRIPVYKGNVNRISGIFHVKDLPQWRDFNVEEKSIAEFMESRYKLKPNDAETLIRPPFFASENRRVSALMRDFFNQKTHMAILLDDRGHTSGLATMEDIIEEIVGEIADEYDYY